MKNLSPLGLLCAICLMMFASCHSETDLLRSKFKISVYFPEAMQMNQLDFTKDLTILYPADNQDRRLLLVQKKKYAASRFLKAKYLGDVSYESLEFFNHLKSFLQNHKSTNAGSHVLFQRMKHYSNLSFDASYFTDSLAITTSISGEYALKVNSLLQNVNKDFFPATTFAIYNKTRSNVVYFYLFDFGAIGGNRKNLVDLEKCIENAVAR